MAQPYPITGIQTGMQTRLELRDLQKNHPIHFSLFIQGMNKVVNMNNQDPQSGDYYNKPNSWWQMGAIHGLPYIPWSGDPNGPQAPVPSGPKDPLQEERWEGYCYHASALFPPWHRILLLLVEQSVVEQAGVIANTTGNAAWIQAAKELRFPFWDWTRAETAVEGIPQLLQQPKVEIVSVDGPTITVDNPLNHYKYAAKPGAAKHVEYMGEWTRTYRWANQDVNPTEELYTDAQKAFAEGTKIKVGDQTPSTLQPLHWLRAKVAALFTYDLTVPDPGYGGNMWGYFSNTGAQDDLIDPVMITMPPSIEEPHNQVHLHCGGNGSMSLNEYAGFDPIFWLHHCNVDRIYALWEYLYPEYWAANGWKHTVTKKVSPFITDVGTFWQKQGEEVSAATLCHPFRIKASEYWTSEGARSLLNNSPVNKYYTYPAIRDPKTGVEVKVDVPYDTTNLALREQYRQVLFNEFSPDLFAVSQHHQTLSGLSTVHAQHANLLMSQVNGVTNLRQFTVVGTVPGFAFPGSYRLELYELNQPGTNVVNSISVLGRADPDRCAACVDRRDAGKSVRGHMPLDPRLVTHLVGKIPVTQLAAAPQLDHVAAVIHGSLGVRIVKPDGSPLATADPDAPAHLDALHESKTPTLTLHSHVIQLNHTDPSAPVKFAGHEQHGTFGGSLAWKATS